jgi:hypothetical protein
LWGITCENSHESEDATIEFFDGDADTDPKIAGFTVPYGESKEFCFTSPVVAYNGLYCKITNGTVDLCVIYRLF